MCSTLEQANCELCRYHLFYFIYYVILLLIIIFKSFIITLQDAEKRGMTEIHKRIADKYRRLATEDVLRSSRLAHPDLLQMTDLPAKLIFHLYQHHCGLSQSVGSRVTCEPGVWSDYNRSNTASSSSLYSSYWVNYYWSCWSKIDATLR